MSCNCENIIIEVPREGIDGNGIASIELLSESGVEKTYRINYTNGDHYDYVVTDGSSIESISKTSTDNLVDTYTILLTNGDTNTFTVTNGNGIANITKVSSVGLVDVYQISYTNGTNATYQVTNGEDGAQGPAGTGIVSITKTGSAGLVDTYTVLLSNSDTYTFTVTNGADGDKGDTGNGIDNIELLSTVDLVKTYRINFTDGDHFDYEVSDGEQGETGQTGATGNGIASISKTGSTGAVDHYRILFTSGDHFDYDVTNGTDVWGDITGTLSDQTDLRDALDNKADIITVSKSGDIVSISDGAPMPVSALSVSVEPVQSGSGDPAPDNVRPISGHTQAVVTRTGVNLLGGEAFANRVKAAMTNATIDTTAKTVYYDASNTATEPIADSSIIPWKENTAYTIIMSGISGSKSFNIQVRYTDGTYSYPNISETPTSKTTYAFVTNANKTVEYLSKRSGSGSTTFYYDEFGVFEGVLTSDDFVSYQGTQVTISLGSTVYGGMLDVLTGTLTVTWASVVLSSLTHGNMGTGTYGCGMGFEGLPYPAKIGESSTSKTGSLCSALGFEAAKYYNTTARWDTSEIHRDKNGFAFTTNDKILIHLAGTNWTSETFLAEVSSYQFVYPLATPQTVTLTANQISTLLGQNNIFADCGTVSVEYRADTKMYVDQTVQGASQAIKLMLTPNVETEMKASKNYTSGSIVIVGNTFLKTTSAVSSGSNLVIDNNCVVTTVAEWVASQIV